MKTYRLHDTKNDFNAFEIENSHISIRGIVELLQSNPSVSEILSQSSIAAFLDNSVILSGFTRPLLPEISPEVRIQFNYKGNVFWVWEPFGDNSRYWIGPKSDEGLDDILEIEEIFKNYVSPAEMREDWQMKLLLAPVKLLFAPIGWLFRRKEKKEK